ncbi:MAG TPA: trypsin-like peptidase domain-containing protein [Vicinamibacteria bacterium]
MERLHFVHLSGPQSGEEVALEKLPATLGSDEGVDLVVPGSAPQHAMVLRRDAHVVLRDFGSPQGTLLAGQPVREVVLHDGDVVELGSGGPRLRVRLVGGSRQLSETMAYRIVHRTSRSFRRVLLLIALVAAALFGWSFHQSQRLRDELQTLRASLARADEERRGLEARIDSERRRAEVEREALHRRLEDYRDREETLRDRLAEAAGGEVNSLREELSLTRERIHTLESERAAGETVIRRYGAGVCMLQGAYGFRDAEGRPLRQQQSEDGSTKRGADGEPVLSPEGQGPLHKIDFYGTGFLVDATGLVLTNRHLAEPWWNDNEAAQRQRDGQQAHLISLRVFFPQVKEPFAAHIERHSDTVDLALLKVDLQGRRIPVLPLERSRAGAVPGQPVVLVGYPTGIEALLAKVEPGIVKEVLEAKGTSADRVTEALAQRGLIRPSTTQGHIGDVTQSDIVFDAPTTQGGSGGPVFNKLGKVVAVEYAVLSRFGGNSFGVPVTYAVELLAAKGGRGGASQ